MPKPPAPPPGKSPSSPPTPPAAPSPLDDLFSPENAPEEKPKKKAPKQHDAPADALPAFATALLALVQHKMSLDAQAAAADLEARRQLLGVDAQIPPDSPAEKFLREQNESLRKQIYAANAELQPYESELRSALREAESALTRLARTTACGLVNHAGIPTTDAEKQTARATIAVFAQSTLANIRGAQETARKHGLIVTI